MRKYLISFGVLVVILPIVIWKYSYKTPIVEFYYWQQIYDVPATKTIKPSYIKCIDIGIQRGMDFKVTNFVTTPNSKIIPVV